MQLYFAPASPFVRKVVVCAMEVGLNEQIERLAAAAHPVNRDMNIVAVNPLGQVPTFKTDDGEPLYDSRVICEYIDWLAGGNQLIPADAARWRVLREQALADGLLDAALVARYELTIRPTEFQWSDWLKSRFDRMNAALDALAKDVPGLYNRVDLGTISVGCALGYLDFRFGDLEWRKGRDRLAEWFAAFDQRPSMVATQPRV